MARDQNKNRLTFRPCSIAVIDYAPPVSLEAIPCIVPDMREQKLYYFDNNATTQVAPEVVEAMLPFLTEMWGNASSAYRFGHQVKRHLDAAHEKLAALINADPREIVFTSCGTESNNTAIHSALALNPGKRRVVTTAVEHSANVKYGEFLQRDRK